MSIILTPDEIEFLEQLAAAGERGRTVSAPVQRGGLQRLVDAGYVVDRAVSLDCVLYVITDRGRRASSDDPSFWVQIGSKPPLVARMFRSEYSLTL